MTLDGTRWPRAASTRYAGTAIRPGHGGGVGTGQGGCQPAARDIAIVGERAAGRDGQDGTPRGAGVRKRIGSEPPDEIVVGSGCHRHELGCDALAAGRDDAAIAPSAETADRRASLNGSRSARAYAATRRSTSSTVGCRARRSAATLRTAASGCVSRERARASSEESSAGTMRWQRLQRLRDDPPSGSASCPFSRSRARAAPNASAATLRQRQSTSLPTVTARSHTGAAVHLRHGDDRLPFERKDVLVSRGRSAASAAAPRALPASSRPVRRHDVAVATSGTTAPASVESRKRRERAQRIDTDMGVGVNEQPAQACNGVARNRDARYRPRPCRVPAPPRCAFARPDR